MLEAVRGFLIACPAWGVYAGKDKLMLRYARYAIVACSLLVVAALGCAPRSTVALDYPHAPYGNLTQSPHEHYQAVSNVAAQDRAALVEDLDVLFLTDRPTRLTRWHAR